MKDYSKVIDLSKWPLVPEKEIPSEEAKDEMKEKIREHFKNNPDALAEFQKENNNSLENSYLASFQPDSEGNVSQAMKDYINSKNNK